MPLEILASIVTEVETGRLTRNQQSLVLVCSLLYVDTRNIESSYTTTLETGMPS